MKTGSSMIMQGVKKLTPQNCFSELKTHLTRATVTFDYAFKEYSDEEHKLREDEPTRIDQEEPFQALMFEEVEASEDQLAASKLLLQEYAGKFCNDGDKWI